MTSPTAAVLGEIGLPLPVRELATRTWDVIVVGAGHNGLACAAYLARARRCVLVIESRTRVGGASPMEEPFPGVRMSPCAYLAGLLHPLVVEELDLPRRGFQWTPAVNGLFVPFLDGSSIQLWDDDQRCAAEVRALSPGDVAGWHAMSADDQDEWREMNARWFELSTFTPILRVHGELRPREMWTLGDDTPAFNAELIFDRLRYALFPYIYSQAGWITQQDYTMMRPLVMDFP